MHPGVGWYVLSTLALWIAIIGLLVSGFAFLSIYGRLVPMLNETRDQIQDLGDLTANTIGRASDSLDLVELRVSETMGQAADGGKQTTQQALGFASALTGVYLVSRFLQSLKNQWKPLHRKKRRKR